MAELLIRARDPRRVGLHARPYALNGDGNADILFQRAGGLPAIWLMSGTNIIGRSVLANPGTDWHIAAAGDFEPFPLAKGQAIVEQAP